MQPGLRQLHGPRVLGAMTHGRSNSGVLDIDDLVIDVSRISNSEISTLGSPSTHAARAPRAAVRPPAPGGEDGAGAPLLDMVISGAVNMQSGEDDSRPQAATPGVHRGRGDLRNGAKRRRIAAKAGDDFAVPARGEQHRNEASICEGAVNHYSHGSGDACGDAVRQGAGPSGGDGGSTCASERADVSQPCEGDSDGRPALKRRRLRGKQPAPASTLTLGAAFREDSDGRPDGRLRPECNGANSVHSGGPSRSCTSTSTQCFSFVDRDGQLLNLGGAEECSRGGGGGAHLGAGESERRRRRGRPPEADGRPAAGC